MTGDAQMATAEYRVACSGAVCVFYSSECKQVCMRV